MYCATNGLELALDEEYTFLDKGLSAYRAEHLEGTGQLKRFLSLVESGDIKSGSYLIVESLDRLSREEVLKAFDQFTSLLTQGINIVTLSDNKLYSGKPSFTDLIVSLAIMSRAHEESSLKAKRIGDAWRNKHEKARTENKPMGAAIPLWLVLENGEYKLNPERSDVVRKVFDMAVNGFGKALIAKALNADGIVSFKNKTWGASSIDKILHNRAVLGEYQPYSNVTGERIPRGGVITGYFPAVVDEPTFYQALAAIQGRKVAGATKQSARFNLWQGICKCGACGAAIHLVNKGKPPKGNTYLQCANSRKGLCKTKVVRLGRSELVFKEILVKVDSLALVQDSSGKISKELAEAEARLGEQSTKLADYKAGLERSYSDTLAQITTNTEQVIAELEVTKVNLQTSLAAEAITSKEDFFAKLDIESYSGRSRANALLKRLNILVYLLREDKDLVIYVVEQEGVELLAFGDSDKSGIYSRPLTPLQIDKKKILDFDGTMDSSYQILVSEVQLEDTNQTLTDEKFLALVKEMFSRVGKDMPDTPEFKASLPLTRAEILGNSIPD